MVNLKVLVLLCAVIISVCGVDNKVPVDVDPQPNISSSTVPPTNTTTPEPITSTTEPTPKTTTTTASNTTTAATTTTTAKPTTSTAKPTTSTPIPPTPKPTPTPDPTVANWTVNYNNSNNSCIYVQVALQYVILVPKSNKTVEVNVPGDALATGSCEDANKQNLKVTWGQNNSLEFDFGKSNTSKFTLDDLSSTLNVTLESGPKLYTFVHKSPEFSTPLANSYKCARLQTLNLTEESSNVTVAYLHVSHLQYQAFRNTTEKKFDTALDCEASVTPDVVPIIVGCVLATLVVLVLVAYLVGRRRCQARGYLSMFAETKREEDYIPMKNLSCFN